MAHRGVRTTRKGPDDDILALCDISEDWSPRLKADAIRDIEEGTHSYFVPWRSGETDVHVAEGPDGKYLRTDRDSTPANNLLELPDCD